MEWDEIELGQVVTFQRGYDLPHRVRKPGEVPVVTSTGITDTHSEAKEKAPGVVTGRYGTIGEVFFIEVDYWPHNTTLFVKDFHGNYPLFVSYLLRTIDFQSHSDKSGVPGVNRNDLHALRIRIPLTTDEQRAIATALSDVDALIAALDNVIAKKQLIKTATMQQLLTGKKRLPEFVEGQAYKQTEIGIIPNDWEVKLLGEIFRLSSGFSFKSEFFSVEGPIVLTPGNFKLEGGLYFNDRNTKRYVGNFPESTILQKGDLLVVMTDLTPNCNLLGKPAFIDSEETILHNQRIGKINLLSEIVDKHFLYFLLLSTPYLEQIKEQATGSTVRHTSNQSIYAVSLAIPNKVEEQRAIATVLSDMDTEISTIEARRTKTQFIKQSMMQELLTNRTRLV